MILRARDIPRCEMHLVGIADLRRQIRLDRRAGTAVDIELQARERSLALRGEGEIDWQSAYAR